jgi:hypothetical protein
MTEREIPAGLQTNGRKLWLSVVDEYDLGVNEQLLLVQACRCVDTLDRLAVAGVDAELTVENVRGDLVANPLLIEARQQSIVLARLLAALRLPTGEQDGRPQRRTGVRGVYQQRRLGLA